MLRQDEVEKVNRKKEFNVTPWILAGIVILWILAVLWFCNSVMNDQGIPR